jgi:hypothetical protein
VLSEHLQIAFSEDNERDQNHMEEKAYYVHHVTVSKHMKIQQNHIAHYKYKYQPVFSYDRY